MRRSVLRVRLEGEAFRMSDLLLCVLLALLLALLFVVRLLGSWFRDS